MKKISLALILMVAISLGHAQVHLLKNEHFLPESSSGKWDTIFIHNTTGLTKRLTRVLDGQGNTMIQKSETRVDSSWVNYSKDTFSYSSGRVQTWIKEGFQGNEWVKYWRNTYTYDTAGNKLSDLVEEMDTNGWVNFSMNTYFYNLSNNRLIQLFGQIWADSGWQNSYRYNNTYDLAGNMTEIEEKWHSNQWENYSKYTSTHDSAGRTLIEEYASWNSLMPSWVNRSKYDYTYDVYGNLINKISESALFNGWDTSERITYSYDPEGRIMSVLYENYLENNAWINSSRHTYTYDEKWNMQADLYEKWMNNGWSNYSKYSYSFDSQGNTIAGKIEFWQNGGWQPVVDELHLFSQKNGNYSIGIGYRFEAKYIPFLSGIANSFPDEDSFKIFPNPATDKITILFPKYLSGNNIILSLYNLQGKLLLRRTRLFENTEIDVRNLSKGIYFLKEFYGEKEQCQKILKE